ncbi:MAG: hypothetical protein U0610_18015 [bacterium]
MGIETCELVVLGKKGKQQVVFIGNGAELALRDWISIRGSDQTALPARDAARGKIVSRRA